MVKVDYFIYGELLGKQDPKTIHCSLSTRSVSGIMEDSESYIFILLIEILQTLVSAWKDLRRIMWILDLRTKNSRWTRWILYRGEKKTTTRSRRSWNLRIQIVTGYWGFCILFVQQHFMDLADL